MKSIKNMKELDAELALLQSRKVQLEISMKNNVESIKEGMKPLKIAGRILSGFLRKDASHDDFLARALGLGATKLSQNYMLTNLPGPLRKIISFVIGNLTVNLAAKQTTPIAAMLSSMIKGFFYKKSEDLSPETRVTLP